MEQLTVGNGGWVYYQSSTDAVAAWVRFADRAGRLVPVDFFMGNDGLSTDSLRRVPLGRIEAWVNSRVQETAVRSRISVATPDLRKVLSYFDRRWSARLLREPEAASLPPMPSQDETATWHAALKSEYENIFLSSSEERAPIEVPETFDYGDDFYRQVADSYATAARSSHRPAVVIAGKQNVPVSTVHRWIKEARRRKFLSPGRPGKAG